MGQRNIWGQVAFQSPEIIPVGQLPRVCLDSLNYKAAILEELNLSIYQNSNLSTLGRKMFEPEIFCTITFFPMDETSPYIFPAITVPPINIMIIFAKII